MNYELDSYTDAIKDFPSREMQLETRDNTYYHFKTDVFKGLISYSTSQNFGANIITISTERAKEVMTMNKKGLKPDVLEDFTDDEKKPINVNYENGVGQDSLTRFDTSKKSSGAKSNNKKNNRPQLAKPTKPGNENAQVSTKKNNETKKNPPKLIKKNE